jgi:hypothetical protein
VQGLDGLLKPLVKPLQEMQHDTPLWEEKQKEAEHRKKFPWVPSNDELGVDYSAASPAPPRDPLRPPRPPGYPNPDLLGKKKSGSGTSTKNVSGASTARGGSGHATSRSNAANDDGGGEEDDEAVPDEGLLYGGATSDLDAFARERERRKERVETEAKRKVRVARSKAARRHRPLVSRIPWTLLDELEAEKHKLAMEKAVSGFSKT